MKPEILIQTIKNWLFKLIMSNIKQILNLHYIKNYNNYNKKVLK